MPDVAVIHHPGGQLNYNIWATVRDLLGGDNTRVAYLSCTDTTPEQLRATGARAVIIAGGPFSVYNDMDNRARMGYTKELILDTYERIRRGEKVALAGDCLGAQAIAQILGGKVAKGKAGEFSFTKVQRTPVPEEAYDEYKKKGYDFTNYDPLFAGFPVYWRAYASHNDVIIELPPDFEFLAAANAPVTLSNGAVEDIVPEVIRHRSLPIYAWQFHPEVPESEQGWKLFRNFLRIAGVEGVSEESPYRVAFQKLREIYPNLPDVAERKPRTQRRIVEPAKREHEKEVTEYRFFNPPSPILRTEDFVKEARRFICKVVGSDRMTLAFSGGLDSSVGVTLAAEPLGEQLWPYHVDTGSMRQWGRWHESDLVMAAFEDKLPNLIYVDAQRQFLDAMMHVREEPGKEIAEIKRKVFKPIYSGIMLKLTQEIGAKWGCQGTIRPDIDESQIKKGAFEGAAIKSQHNIGLAIDGLVEPLAGVYKHEERVVAAYLGLPKFVVLRQPFPGPGDFVRVIGQVTEEKLELQRGANQIVERGVFDQIRQQYGLPMLIDDDGIQRPFQTFSYTMDNARTEASSERAGSALMATEQALWKCRDHGLGEYKLEEVYFLKSRLTGVKGDKRQYTNPAVVRLKNPDGEPWVDWEVAQAVALALTTDPRVACTRALIDLSERPDLRYRGCIRSVDSAHAMTATSTRLTKETQRRIAEELDKLGMATAWDPTNKPAATVEGE
jgi:GMP synthase (glutamine-hydrolysing)